MKKCKGITLIALVITIIVLLILAGVSLNLIAGEEGILKRATSAVDKNKVETVKEDVELVVADLGTGYYEEKYDKGSQNFGDVDDYIESQFGTNCEMFDGSQAKIKKKKVEVSQDGKLVATGALENGKIINAKKIVLAPGRDGSAWLTKVLKQHGLELYNNQVDIGVRVETSNIVMEEINNNLYEGKFIYNTSVGTKVRTFCSNPSGHVVIENHSGTMLANGHAFHDPKLGSKNTNFALLVSHTFSEPFNQPNEFAHEVSRLANKLSNGSVIVQRYGDIKRGRRTTYKRLKEGYTVPTLPEAVPGDLGLVLPYNTMKSIIEMIEALDNVTPGIANEHTLLYGVEAKFYSARPKVREGFECEIDDLYVAGDGAGLTRGLAQAGANGIIVARHIIKNIK